MSLTAGTRLGPYEVLAPIGAGGMGEVYRARDSKLGRDIALKVLPKDLAADAERRRRFEQEARAASGLNHPNVVHVYDVGETDGTTFIAMELVEGRTLREVTASGPMPPRKLLDVAVQIADGLSRAHEEGIVHRDLKPENVMIAKDGHVRLLDFGLAKLVETTEGDFADRPTSPQITRAGLVVGTAGYMSPEQAAGRHVDFRSDQFSLGTILYELASGQKPFHRATGPETLTAILREAPAPLAPLAPRLPAPLRWIIEERCLAKEPDERYASTRDLLRELMGLRDHLSDASAADVAAPARRLRWAFPVLALLAGLGLGALLYARLAPRASSDDSVSFRRLTFRRGTIPTARFGPDGQTILYSARLSSRPIEVFSTRTDSPESRSLGLPESRLHAISANGDMALSLGDHHVFAWASSGTLARAPLGGGAPREILADVEDADWAKDGRSLAIVREVGGRRRLEFPPEKILYETAGYVSHPRFSPSGDLIAFLDHPIGGDNGGSVVVVDHEGHERTRGRTFTGTDGLAWSPAGDEVWFTAAREGLKSDLWAVNLSGRERRLWHEAGAVSLRDVARDGRVLLSRINQGREIAGLAPGASSERDLTWLDWSYPTSLSADGQTLLFEEEGEGAGSAYAIYLRKTDGSTAVRLAEGGAIALAPDGKTVLGMSPEGLMLIPIGPGTPRTIPLPGLTHQWSGFFPDGRRLLMAANEPGHGSRLFVLDAAGGAPRPFTEEGVVLAIAADAVSPDGRVVAAQGPDRSTRLYPVDGGESRQVPGTSPNDTVVRWTADGRGLYVRSLGLPTRVDIVDVATGRRTRFKEFTPADPAGVYSVGPILISRDGKSYVYSFPRVTEDLYLVDGLK